MGRTEQPNNQPCYGFGDLNLGISHLSNKAANIFVHTPHVDYHYIGKGIHLRLMLDCAVLVVVFFVCVFFLWGFLYSYSIVI